MSIYDFIRRKIPCHILTTVIVNPEPKLLIWRKWRNQCELKVILCPFFKFPFSKVLLNESNQFGANYFVVVELHCVCYFAGNAVIKCICELSNISLPFWKALSTVNRSLLFILWWCAASDARLIHTFVSLHLNQR